MNFLRLLWALKSESKSAQSRWQIDPAHLVWAVGSLCALHRIPFDAELLLKHFPPPYTTDTLIHAARALGFRIKRKACVAARLGRVTTPCIVVLDVGPENSPNTAAHPDAPQYSASFLDRRLIRQCKAS